MKVYDNIVTGKTPSKLYEESRAISGEVDTESMYQHILDKSPMLRETLERSQKRQEHYSHLYEPSLRSQAQTNVKQIDMDMLPMVSHMAA